MATEEAKADARARRRQSEAKNRKTPLSAPLTTEPSSLIEALCPDLVKRLLEIANATEDEALEASICHRLLALSSLGRTKVDVSAQLARQDVPDLSAFPPEQLVELIKLAQGMTEPIKLEIPEKTEGNGHAGADAAENSPA